MQYYCASLESFLIKRIFCLPSSFMFLKMQNQRICPVCKSEENSLKVIKDGYRVFQCSSCTHLFVHPVPSYENLRSLYSSDRGYHKDKYESIFDGNHKYPDSMLDNLRVISKFVPAGKILDVGCSNGEFLYLAKERGYHVQGVELNPMTASAAMRNGIPVHNGVLQDCHFEDGSFDVIYLSHVMEHIDDIDIFVREVVRIIRPGGLLAVGTPNHDAFFPRSTFILHRVFRIPWSHPTPPEHLHQFSWRSMMCLLERYGFEVQECHYSNCSLIYEIGATHVFSNLKRAAKDRELAKAFAMLPVAMLILVLYPFLFFFDSVFLPNHRKSSLFVFAKSIKNP